MTLCFRKDTRAKLVKVAAPLIMRFAAKIKILEPFAI